ncbi:MAG: SDR family oxidoreductase [Bacteroidetes bacterium]|nr:SDR family oxidoreductase [Bacteroidota bacterium]
MARIVIVGGSYGIGLEVVKQLSEEENEVIVLSRTNEFLSTLNNVTHYYFDANDSTSFPIIEEAVDGLVYCPGSINLKPFTRYTATDFSNDLQINAISAALVMQQLLPNLKASPEASVVFFSTIAVQVGMPFHASISMAKGAVEGLAKSLAAEYAPKIRVNCIAPSITETPLSEKLINTNEKKDAVGNRHPLKRIGTTKDVANIVTFLLSKKSSWITGQLLHVDGGLSTLKL